MRVGTGLRIPNQPSWPVSGGRAAGDSKFAEIKTCCREACAQRNRGHLSSPREKQTKHNWFVLLPNQKVTTDLQRLKQTGPHWKVTDHAGRGVARHPGCASAPCPSGPGPKPLSPCALRPWKRGGSAGDGWGSPRPPGRSFPCGELGARCGCRGCAGSAEVRGVWPFLPGAGAHD